MKIVAEAKYIRVSPRKMQLLARGVKSMDVNVATQTLTFLHKSGATALRKVLLSALANAKNKNVSGELMISEIQVLQGSFMKRFRAVSRGMAHTYKKRMSHVKVILTEKPKPEVKSNIKTKVEDKKKV